MLQAVMSDTSTKVMQSPEVRVSDGQKVELKIGDRIPYASGSFQPGIGTVGVSPLVSTQFQFADTGVNMTITPHVHGNDEVTLDITRGYFERKQHRDHRRIEPAGDFAAQKRRAHSGARRRSELAGRLDADSGHQIRPREFRAW